MKIFSLEYQIIAGVISSTYGKPQTRYFNAGESNNAFFKAMPESFWRNTFTMDALKATKPKFWQKWIDRKSGQFPKLGEQVKRPNERCGTNYLNT